MTILKTLSEFWLVLRLQARQAFYHRAAVIASVISWAVRMGLTILFYKGVYEILNQDHVKGLTFEIAATSMILYAVLNGFNSRDIFRLIDGEFKSGAIELWLNKPIPYVVMKIGEN